MLDRVNRGMLIGVSVIASIVGLAGAPTASAAPVDAAALESRLGADVSLSDDTDRVSFIGADRSDPLAAAGDGPVETAKSFLGSHAFALGLEADGTTLVTEGVTPAPYGGKAVRISQEIDGVPVIGGEFVVNVTAGGDVLSVGGESEPAPALDTEPEVDAPVAAATAVMAAAKDLGLDPASLIAGAPEISILDDRILGGPDLGNPALVWKFDLTSPSDLSVNQFVAVNAHTGEVALQFSQTEYGGVRSVCNAGGLTAQVPCTTPVASPGSSSDNNIKHAYDYAGATYDFYFSRFGRDSLDGAGLALTSTVRYCKPADSTPAQCPYKNAFWNGAQMVYGLDYPDADDVVGHELTHGVTQFSNGLEYYYQSGAINESMSDVFGEFVDFYNFDPDGSDLADRWIHGEKKPAGTGRRSMKDPPNSIATGGAAVSYPDRMTSPHYRDDPTLIDSGGVHYNSGVGNKAAYLISDGDTFNGRTVTALGTDKTARIYYQVETNYLTSGSDYADLGNYLVQACSAMVGTSDITAANCTEVADAVAATEMSVSPPAAPAVDAPFCNAGYAPSGVVFSDNLENGAVATANWIRVGTPVYWFSFAPTPASSVYATSGKNNFRALELATSGTGTVAMKSSYTIPTGAYLRFNHSFGFEQNSAATTFYDGGIVEYSTTGGSTWTQVPSGWFTHNGYTQTLAGGANPLGGSSAFAGRSHGYISSRIDLSALAGQSARFRFVIGTDSSNDPASPIKGWFIDDINLYACAAIPPPPPPPPATPRATTRLTRTVIKGRNRFAKFSFRGTHATRYQCKLDGKRFGRCTSPRTYRHLRPGRHAFRVRALGPGGTDLSPALRRFRIPRPHRRRHR